MEHNIKINENFYKRILSGDKTFEVRFNDQDYQVGDTVVFSPIDNYGVKVSGYKPQQYEITYVLGGFLGLREGYVVLSIKKV